MQENVSSERKENVRVKGLPIWFYFLLPFFSVTINSIVETPSTRMLILSCAIAAIYLVMVLRKDESAKWALGFAGFIGVLGLATLINPKLPGWFFTATTVLFAISLWAWLKVWSIRAVQKNI